MQMVAAAERGGVVHNSVRFCHSKRRELTSTYITTAVDDVPEGQNRLPQHRLARRQDADVAVGFAVRSAIRKARAAGQPPPEVPAPDVSQGHIYLMHRVHTADPNDGWLQREWGEVLVSEGRLADAAVHFEARAPTRKNIPSPCFLF